MTTPPSETPTPRVDALMQYTSMGRTWVPLADARQLERELAAARAELAQATDARMKEANAYANALHNGRVAVDAERALHRAEVDRLRADLAAAQKLVAEMHAAAVGEIRGPARGVVEDVADLRSDLARARRDGERYRFLREHVTFQECETLSPLKYYYRRWYHDTVFKLEADTCAGMFDAAIDAALAERKDGDE